MENINGYHFEKSEGHNSPNGTWYKATFNGKQYFLKKFQQPKFPKDGINPEIYQAKKKECDEWIAAKRKLVAALNELGDGTGNIISPRDVFRENLCFYQATYWIDVQTDSLDQIRRYALENKIMLLKTYSAALKKVHSKEIIHGDLKPENVLIAKSASGKPVAKLIDFDDSYFSKQALSPELTIVTDAYQSPELAAYKRGHVEYRDKLTCASDVFASGIIFHQFWCGEMPAFPGRAEGKFLFEAVATGQNYQLDKSLPPWLRNLIRAMLLPMPEERPTMEQVHAAVTAQSFDGPPDSKPQAVRPGVNYSELDAVWARIPQDLTGYSSESAKALQETCDKIAAIRQKADQTTIDKCTRLLHSAIRNLQKAASMDYSKIDRILAAIPRDLSDYSSESANKLRQAVRLVEANRDLTSQDEVDKLTKVLYAAYKGLQAVQQETFSIQPARELPKGYTKVKILSETKVQVYRTDGSKMTIPRVVALSMKLVKER